MYFVGRPSTDWPPEAEVRISIGITLISVGVGRGGGGQVTGSAGQCGWLMRESLIPGVPKEIKVHLWQRVAF